MPDLETPGRSLPLIAAGASHGETPQLAIQLSGVTDHAGTALLASLAAGRAANRRLPATALRHGFAVVILAVTAAVATAALSAPAA